MCGHVQTHAQTTPRGSATERHWTERPDIEADCYNSECGGKPGLEETERSIHIFLRKCLLPLARRTNALIILEDTDDCSLSNAWGKLCAAERDSKADGKMSFTTISISCSPRHHAQAEIENSTPHQLKKGSRRWRANEPAMLHAMRKSFGHDHAGWFWTLPPQVCVVGQ